MGMGFLDLWGGVADWFKAPDAPDPIDPSESALDYVRGMADPELQETILSSEREYRPQYQALNLQDMLGYLQGSGGQMGMLDMQDLAAGRTEGLRADVTSRQRASDIADVEGLGTRATAALRASDPLMEALIGKQTGLTNELYDRAGGLSPQQKRQADQQAREAFASRGRVGDNSAVAAEILNREEFKRANRAEAQQAASQTYNMYKGTAADPFQAILGRPSGSLNQGLETAGQARGAVGQSTSQLFNADAGVNLALQENANLMDFQNNLYGAKMGMIGGVAQGAGSAAAAFSDRRLKKNIVRVGTHKSGVGVYSYTMKHNGRDEVGVMAQELQGVMPEAVSTHPNGYLMVDYSKL